MPLRNNRGEQTASAMENQLTTLERKIDELLASAESHSKPNANNQDGAQDGNNSKVGDSK